MRRFYLPTVLFLLMAIGVSFHPTPASSTSGCFEFWDWKTSLFGYEHGGAGEEPEGDWTFKGTYDSEEATSHDWFEGGKAEDSHGPCGDGGDPD